jgi:hypothetical protein
MAPVSSSVQARPTNPYPLPSPSVPDSLGVNIHFTDPGPGEMDLLSKAGFKWIRMDFAWEGIEREKGKYDFSAYERLLSALKPHGIRAIFILDYGNALYQEGSPRSPEARAAFGRFATAAVKQFQGRGILWEMYNEPNIGFWKPKPNVDEYIALAKETGRAIRAAAPEEWYIGPATSGMDFTFMERCFQAGLLEYWDAVSFHPYRNTPPETAAPDFHRVRELIEKYAPKGKKIPILSGEWGYSELYSGLSREKQARYISREYLSNMMNGLILSIWYDWHDDGTDPKETEHHFGTVFNDYKPKPTYEAIKTLATALDGFRLNKRLALASPEDYCLLFDKGNTHRLAAWTTSAQSHEVTLPTAAGSYQVTGNTGKTSEVTAEGSGLKLMLSDEPQYLAPQSGFDVLLYLAAGWSTIPQALKVRDENDLARALQPLSTGTWIAPEKGYPVKARLKVEMKGEGPDSAQHGWSRTLDFKIFEADPHPPSLGSLPPLQLRSEDPIALRATLTVPGMPGEVSQETKVVSAAPLRLTPMFPSAGVLPVRVENLSGQPFEGRIRSESDKKSQPIRFKMGESEKIVSLPTEAKESGSYRGKIVLEEKIRGDYQPALATPSLSVSALPLPINPDGSCQAVPDGDPKVASTINCSKAHPPGGLPIPAKTALKITYDFQPGWKFLRVPALDSQRKPLTGQPYALGMWVYGDRSEDLIRIRFTDSTGQTFQPDGGPVSWKGWRYVTFSLLGDQAGHWGGADDGIVHPPIRFDTLFLVDSPGGRGGRGKLYVAGLTLFSRQ